MAGLEVSINGRIWVPTEGAGCTWLLTEIDPEDTDIAFGLCDLGMGWQRQPLGAGERAGRPEPSGRTRPGLQPSAAHQHLIPKRQGTSAGSAPEKDEAMTDGRWDARPQRHTALSGGQVRAICVHGINDGGHLAVGAMGVSQHERQYPSRVLQKHRRGERAVGGLSLRPPLLPAL